ncbi:MAG: hypothetical protein PHG91_08795 [Syntrophales bacterium]|nr:hypothetical protein [Syntrophales bacterium]MDD5233480.1 hypothetical protein [Syntrophales bacterium]MDD5532324.1 hypothetical protein [Syntrophales bacterium]
MKGRVLLAIIFLVFISSSASAESRDIVKFGSDLMIEEGMNIRDAVVFAGDITVDGPVERDVTAIGGSVVLTNRAVVGRNVVSIGGAIEGSEEAAVNGNLTEVNLPGLYTLITTFSGGDWTGPFLLLGIWSLLTFAGFIVLAVIFAAIFPGLIRSLSDKIEARPIGSFLSGLGASLLIVPLGILLAITIVGLLLIPVEIFLVSAGFLLGYIGTARLIGKRLSAAVRKTEPPIVWETFWGVIALGMIGLIPVLGWAVNFLAALFGFGGAVLLTAGLLFPDRKI